MGAVSINGIKLGVLEVLQIKLADNEKNIATLIAGEKTEWRGGYGGHGGKRMNQPKWGRGKARGSMFPSLGRGWRLTSQGNIFELYSARPDVVDVGHHVHNFALGTDVIVTMLRGGYFPIGSTWFFPQTWVVDSGIDQGWASWGVWHLAFPHYWWSKIWHVLGIESIWQRLIGR